MGTAVAIEQQIPMDGRVAVLSETPEFASLESDALLDLAGLMTEESFVPGNEVMTEGNPVDALYVIFAGRTEISSSSPDGRIVLATQDRGEMFGELALVSATRRTTARRTATALTPLTVLRLDTPAATRFVELHPDLRVIFETPGEVMLVARFLKRVSTFANVPFDRARQLAKKLEPFTIAPGEILMRQGEMSDVFYLLRAGKLEVLLRADDEERCVATLGPGVLVGEASLLSDEPRNATLRAIEPCELLGLRRSVLMDALRTEDTVAREILELMRLRDRPKQATGIEWSRQDTSDGTIVFILKNAETSTYYRLSAEGWFVWELLDGDHTLRDLTLAYHERWGTFSPQVIAKLIRDLSDGGFVESLTNLCRDVVDVAKTMQQEHSWHRGAALARKALEFQLSLRDVDDRITRVYRSGFFLLYTLPAQLVMAVLAVAGGTAFLLGTIRAVDVVGATDLGLLLLVFLLPAEWLAVLLHEAGHAFTVKAFGRTVNRVGIGWYWYRPTTFVDTSDMWLASRWPRIAVSLGGPYINLVFGGAVALIGYLSPSDVMAAICWEVALTSFIIFVVNLNPLLEYDGYYVLMDLVEHPNLRSDSLRWLGTDLPRAIRHPRELWKHKLELIYGISAVLYTIALGVATLVVYRVALEGYLSDFLPAKFGAPIAWALVLGVMSLAAMSLLGQIRGVRSQTG